MKKIALTICLTLTLLKSSLVFSQIDSCIGGKTSINYGSRKNILGTFYPPKTILICDEFLYSLSHEDFYSGIGELLKFDILRNKIINFCKWFRISNIK